MLKTMQSWCSAVSRAIAARVAKRTSARSSRDCPGRPSAKVRHFLFLLLLAASLEGTSTANAAVISNISQSVLPPPSLLPYRLEPQGAQFDVFVPGFDPGLGALQAVDIQYIVLGSSVGWGVVNAPGDPYQIEIRLSARVSLPNGTEILSDSDTKLKSGSTGNFGFQDLFNLLDDTTLTDPAALAFFVSGGTIPLTYQADFSFVPVSGNATSQGGAVASGSLGGLNIVYTFDPDGNAIAVPLPSSLLLFASGLLISAGFLGRGRASGGAPGA